MARDGREAELSLHHDVYDLVLLDLGLPKADGIALLGSYRRRGGTAPVLVITARDGIESRIAGLDAGADDYLIKPFGLRHSVSPSMRSNDRSSNIASHGMTQRWQVASLLSVR